MGRAVSFIPGPYQLLQRRSLMRVRPRLRALRELQFRDLRCFLKRVYLDISLAFAYILIERMIGGWVAHAEAVAAISQQKWACAAVSDLHKADSEASLNMVGRLCRVLQVSRGVGKVKASSLI